MGIMMKTVSVTARLCCLSFLTKIMFDLLLVTVIDKVDARIHDSIPHLRISSHPSCERLKGSLRRRGEPSLRGVEKQVKEGCIRSLNASAFLTTNGPT